MPAFFRVRTEACSQVRAKSGRKGKTDFGQDCSQSAPLILDNGDQLEFAGVSTIGTQAWRRARRWIRDPLTACTVQALAQSLELNVLLPF
jgi:hypothetical protein